MAVRGPHCYVYIVTNANKRALYVGVTDDLRRSMQEHRSKLAGGFTAKYDVDRLVYYEISPDMMTAGERKKAIRKLEREEKNRLIEESNPGWKDLGVELEQDEGAMNVV